MKVTQVNVFPVRTPRENGTISPHGILTVETDSGILGLGEMSDFGHSPVLPDFDEMRNNLRKTFIGLDPFDLPRVENEVRRYGGLVGVSIDLAMYDIRGKALGLPVYKLLSGGSAYRDKMGVCYPIFPVSTFQEAEENLQRVGRVLNWDFTMIRYYCSGGNLEAEEYFLKNLKPTYGDKLQLKSLDLSNRFTPERAIEIINRFEKYGFMLAESPSRNVEDKAKVRAAVGLPISEHVSSASSILELASHKAIDICNIAVVSGGLTHAKKLFNIAEAVGLSGLIGTTQELSIGTSAQAHLAAAVSNIDYPGDPAGGRLYMKDVVKERVVYKDGYLYVPQGPGLGMELDEAKLAEITFDPKAG